MAIDYFAQVWDKKNPEQKSFIRSCLKQIAENGVVKENVKAQIAWMNWKV